MTGDQRLIVKLEDVLEKLGTDELLAAYHLLDEVVKELESLSRNPAPRSLPRMPATAAATRTPAAAAG